MLSHKHTKSPVLFGEILLVLELALLHEWCHLLVRRHRLCSCWQGWHDLFRLCALEMILLPKAYSHKTSFDIGKIPGTRL
jgi:hypothetical protein